MNKEQAVTYLKFSGFSDEQVKAIEGAFSCPSAGIDCEDCPAYEKKTGHCKDCKHFEYDSFAKVDGVPLIVAHEICSRWGDGCKTSEDGYCFLFEPKEDKS